MTDRPVRGNGAGWPGRMRVPGWMDEWGGGGLVDDDETVSMGSFARAKHEKQQGQEKEQAQEHSPAKKKQRKIRTPKKKADDGAGR